MHPCELFGFAERSRTHSISAKEGGGRGGESTKKKKKMVP